MVKLIVVSLTLFIAGCVSPVVNLSKGDQMIECSSFGFGLITGEMAKSRVNKCVDEAQEKGYRIDKVRQ